jgi:diguanylate cyclase (GGDEF)-like protein
MSDMIADASLRRTAAFIVLALAVVVGGTWLAVKTTTDYLLYQDATASAENWANTLAENVRDIEQIANGETPLSESMAFFDWARKTGSVFRYVIYNTAGYSQLYSEDVVAPVGLSEFSPEAVETLESAAPVVNVIEGTSPDRPQFYGRAFVPVFDDGRPVAVISAFVDQTASKAAFTRALIVAGGSLSLLTALAFGLPAFAWYRRTKEKQVADRRIRYLAHHDALTGLVNRSQLMELLDRSVVARIAEGSGLAVHFLDLDKFKEVNDSLGHDGGDFLLRSVAERLRSVSRANDFAARLGGDEFVVVQDGVRDQAEASRFADRLAETLSAPVMFNGNEIVSTASIGVALAPKDGTASERLLKCADMALYESKAGGRNQVQFFLPDMDAELQARLALEKRIRDAARNETFELHYQPVYETAGRHLVGFEALARLADGDGGFIEPEVFIPVAEDLRVIGKVGAWILTEACRTAVNWPEHLTVAVNLSPVQFELGSVSRVVQEALDESGLAANRLELEITERLLLSDSEEVMDELRRLKEMGVAVVMDDFGTGYSSLSYLWRFPFNKIKIDRSFMQGFDDARQDAETVIRTIIALGRQLHMQVTVEGVETANQAAFLGGADAEQVQGFFFSRPLPATEVAACILADMDGDRAKPTASRPVEAGKRA